MKPSSAPRAALAFQVGLAIVVLGLSARQSAAYDWRWGDASFALDTTLTFGVSLRTQSPDRKNFCTTIGGPNALAPGTVVPDGAGTGPGANGDCGKSAGNLNFNVFEPVSTALRGIHEFEVEWGSYSALVRAQWWYDGINEHGERARTPLTDNARWRAGAGGELLDAYIQGNWYPRDMPVSVKIGNQVLNWGESTFLQNGISVINPIDVNRLRVPGAELREAFLAIPMIWGSIAPNEYVSLEGFYQFQWRETYIDPPGTFFSAHDALGPGGRYFDISQGAHDCDISPFAFTPGGPTLLGFRQNGSIGATCVERGRDMKARNEGQFGFAARIFVPQLASTEFGLFFINFHSRVPLTGGSYQETALAAAFRLFGPPPYNAGQFAQAINEVLIGTRANQFYPEDIKKFGLSFSTAIDRLSLAIQGEVAYTKDQPLQLSEIELLRGLFGSALIPGIPPAPGTPVGPPGQFISGAVIKDYVSTQATFTYVGEPGRIIGGVLGADQFLAVFEMGYIGILEFDDVLFRPLQGSVTPQAVVAGNTANQFSGFGTQHSAGYVIRAALPYNNRWLGMNIVPFAGYSHGIYGVTPAPLLNYVSDSQAINLGFRLEYQNSWSFQVDYTNFFGGGDDNPRNDRDFLAFNIKYGF